MKIGINKLSKRSQLKNKTVLSIAFINQSHKYINMYFVILHIRCNIYHCNYIYSIFIRYSINVYNFQLYICNITLCTDGRSNVMTYIIIVKEFLMYRQALHDGF